MPIERNSHAQSVQRRVVRSHALPSSPVASAATPNANGTDEAGQARVEHERVDHHHRVLEQRVEALAVRHHVAGRQLLEGVRDEVEQHEEEGAVAEQHRAHPGQQRASGGDSPARPRWSRPRASRPRAGASPPGRPTPPPSDTARPCCARRARRRTRARSRAWRSSRTARRARRSRARSGRAPHGARPRPTRAGGAARRARRPRCRPPPPRARDGARRSRARTRRSPVWARARPGPAGPRTSRGTWRAGWWRGRCRRRSPAGPRPPPRRRP